MSTFERLLEVCGAVFEGEIDVDSITPESNLHDDINMNSIGLLYMAMAIEEEFGVRFTNDDYVNITTISDVVDIIEKKA